MSTQESTRFSVLAALVAVALALTGCSSAEAKKPKAEESPLQKYMYAMWGGEEQSREFYAKQELKSEELIAKCMAKEGFEYKPNPQIDMAAVESEEEIDAPELGSVKFAETYGYGMFEGPSGPGFMSMSFGNMPVDPNQEYLDSLSESEQRAYGETLNGPSLGEDEMNIEDEGGPHYDFSKLGCKGAVFLETSNPGKVASEDPEFKELSEQMNKVYSGLSNLDGEGSSNDDIVKLDRKWADCMTKAGLDFSNPMQAKNSVINELAQEWHEAQGLGDSETGEYKEPSQQIKDKFQEKEIKAAVTDAKCQEKINYTDEQRRITYKIEQKFIDEHKTQLEAMLAKYGTKKQDK